MDGYINVLKPPGMTSAAVVGCVKRLSGARCGHLGTLDPEAAGVLPVMLGRATKLFDVLVDKQKRYVAEIAFGAATDTQDAQGAAVQTGENYPSYSDIQAALPRFLGDILQAPPAYSALKQGGVPLYKLARRGEAVETQPRTVTISSIDLLRETKNHGALLRVACGKGTYIRTLCHDIGQALGCPAHMRFLLREQSGAFDLSTARTLEELRENLADALLPPDWALSHLPARDVDPAYEKPCANGVALPECAFSGEPAALFRAYLGGRFAGVMEKREGGYKFKAMLL